MFSNDLTAPEIERLVILMEEAAEVQQAAAKILRHGYQSNSPFRTDELNNRNDLAIEMGHMYAVIETMMRLGDVSTTEVHVNRNKKDSNVLRYLHYDSWNTRFPVVAKASLVTAQGWNEYHRWGATRTDAYGKNGYAVCEHCALSDVYAGRESVCQGRKA
jgi:hypothetical protein